MSINWIKFTMHFAPRLLLLSLLGYSVFGVAQPYVIYGKASLSAQLADEGDGHSTEFKSNTSRLGVSGEFDMSPDAQLVYRVEWGIDLADLTSSKTIQSRDQYIGVTGNLGTLLVGRKNNGLKNVTSPVDVMNGYEGDLKGLWQGDERYSDSVNYISPVFNTGFAAEFNYVRVNKAKGDDSFISTIYYGDRTLNKSTWYAAVGYASKANGFDVQRLLAKAKMGSWIFGAVAHREKNNQLGDPDSGILLNSQYSIGKWQLSGQYQTLSGDNSVSLMVDYKLAKSSKIYAWLTDRRAQQDAQQSWLAIGVEHKF
ncbi:porin [Paraglaciecola aquimarina]|uniref:Porin n=1 Tax=Paraglaciecola aquimarina TaxID=1235557 RepID=A0ABU3T0Q1_9ALTE|nr:porin [Paraglaciecola aquimarina]MDU0355839.1 porin [Paraglaciecola aquimarina]